MRTARFVLAAVLALAAWSGPAAFEAPAREKIALEALRLAPPRLRKQLARHSQDLVRGAREKPSDSLDLDAKTLATEVDAAVALINAHKPFRIISESFGRVAGLAACLNDPLWSSLDGEGSDDSRKFSAYFVENMTKFPLVFTGADAALETKGSVPDFAAAVRERYKDDRASLLRAYHPPDGGPVLPSDFDERSIPFAIASLCYSRAVTDASQLWIHIWRRANGDLSGTPYVAVDPENHP